MEIRIKINYADTSHSNNLYFLIDYNELINVSDDLIDTVKGVDLSSKYDEHHYIIFFERLKNKLNWINDSFKLVYEEDNWILQIQKLFKTLD